MDTKKCRVCGEIKHVDKFSKNKSCKDGIRSECKACYNIYFREYFADKEKMQKQSKRVHKNKKEYRWKVEQHKLNLGCSRCGYNKCAGALHFHHIDPSEKEFMISKAFCRSMSKDKLDKELKKCILLCANCHAEIEEKVRKNNNTI